MKTTREIGIPRAVVAPHGRAAYARSATQSIALQQALARIGNLERTLALSQQESVAAHQQVEVLTKANAQLREFVRHPDHEGKRASQSPPWKETDFLSVGVDPEATSHIERLLTKRIRFRRGDAVYRIGDEFNALYTIRAGSCKTNLLASGGQDQVAGYHMTGETVGLDGIATDVHVCQATALEDMEVCPLPFDQVEKLARQNDRFRHNLHKLLSQECARAQTLMLVLGTMQADKRLAVFLLDLSARYLARGYSASEFVLRMTREEIGSYLGLKLETVSRLLSRFQQEGIVQVQGRLVKLLDRGALAQLVDCA